MAFVKFELRRGHGKKIFNRVSAYCSDVRRNQIFLCISNDIAKKIKISAGNKMSVLIGTGTDTGKLAFHKSDREIDNLLSIYGKNNLRISVSCHAIPALSKKFPVTSLPFEIKNKRLIVDFNPLL